MGFYITDENKRWPGGYIPFKISDTDFPIGSSKRKIVEKAISHWNSMSNVRLVPFNGEDDYCVFQIGTVNSGLACQSDTGRTGGGSPQSIICTSDGKFTVGNLIHEIGHAFGLMHEHQRPDRDDYVIIDQSVATDENYKILDNGTKFGPYDCCSIMHYPEALNKMTKQDATCEGMGQRIRLSEGDLATIKFMYPDSNPCNLPELSDQTHSGYFVQGTFGSQGNFELVVPQGKELKHYFRDNDQPNHPWNLSSSQPNAALWSINGRIVFIGSSPTSVSLIQSNFKPNGCTGNLEMIVRMTPDIDFDGTGDWLAQYYFDSKTRSWNGPSPVIVNGNEITGVTGNPAFIQSTFSSTQGNFELVVPQGKELKHYFRDNDQPNHPWNLSGSQPNAALWSINGRSVFIGSSPTSVSLIQSNFKPNDYTGNLEMIVRMTPDINPDGTRDWLAQYYFDSKTRSWNGPSHVIVNGNEITGVTGD
ncbi:M12 family metallopeptidase [Bacillus safensis]|uniref:M12 family metallopeptidase n=1 Tax=Bacillus safensis TaxID=561879 RepID=UPI001246908B|nr:M12 family metallopeptidase [Bacillus safensis]